MDSGTRNMLRSMLRFLALPTAEKLEFLPAVEPPVTYLMNECGDRTEDPLLYYVNAVFELTERSVPASSQQFQSLVLDINSLLAVMIEQTEAYPYIWHLDKARCPVTGPADRLWNILERLAREALAMNGWVTGRPEIPFSQTDWDGTMNEAK